MTDIVLCVEIEAVTAVVMKSPVFRDIAACMVVRVTIMTVSSSDDWIY
jgi:hypothetical protein